VDDDAEEEEDVEEEAGGGEDDDGEQGTLRFGTKKEVSGYEEDEADGDGEEEEKNQNNNGIDKLAVDKNASHNTNGNDSNSDEEGITMGQVGVKLAKQKQSKNDTKNLMINLKR
jgi:hypothetical protein